MAILLQPSVLETPGNSPVTLYVKPNAKCALNALKYHNKDFWICVWLTESEKNFFSLFFFFI